MARFATIIDDAVMVIASKAIGLPHIHFAGLRSGVKGLNRFRAVSWRSRPRQSSWAGSDIPASSLRKLLDAHSVGSIGHHDFGVFTITNIAMENTDAVPPVNPIARTPNYLRSRGRRPPPASLTCLARLTAWQSLCTGQY